MKKRITELGEKTIHVINSVGRLVILLFDSFVAIKHAPSYTKEIVEQFIIIGRRSLIIVLFTSVFIGMAMGVQIGMQKTAITPNWILGGLILRSMVFELGPVIMGLILAGRIAAGIAAEIGTMKVTEQIDALRSFALNPIEILVMPRLIAAIFAVPILLIFADFVGISFSFVAAYFTVNLSWADFVKGMRHDFLLSDVIAGQIKGLIFGIIIVLFGSFFGFNSQRGAKGVGHATTFAVVIASISILVLDYIISSIAFYV